MNPEWEQQKNAHDVRQLARCACGRAKSRVVTYTKTRSWPRDRPDEVTEKTMSSALPEICECGARLHFRDVVGKFRAGKACDSRCMNSTSTHCECSCGGKNHGASFSC